MDDTNNLLAYLFETGLQWSDNELTLLQAIHLDCRPTSLRANGIDDLKSAAFNITADDWNKLFSSLYSDLLDEANKHGLKRREEAKHAYDSFITSMIYRRQDTKVLGNELRLLEEEKQEASKFFRKCVAQRRRRRIKNSIENYKKSLSTSILSEDEYSFIEKKSIQFLLFDYVKPVYLKCSQRMNLPSDFKYIVRVSNIDRLEVEAVAEQEESSNLSNTGMDESEDHEELSDPSQSLLNTQEQSRSGGFMHPRLRSSHLHEASEVPALQSATTFSRSRCISTTSYVKNKASVIKKSTYSHAASSPTMKIRVGRRSVDLRLQSAKSRVANANFDPQSNVWILSRDLKAGEVIKFRVPNFKCK